MSKLTLQFEGRMLKDYEVGPLLTIGRRPDNAIVIDHPAVSPHHARIVCEGGEVLIEDLHSANGTFVNAEPVRRQALHHGDVVLIGKHHLVFDLETPLHRVSRAGTTLAPLDADVDARPPKPTARVATLHVIAGVAEELEYDLTAQTSLIGRSRDAHVRLRGWFTPSVAAAIARSSDGYVIAPMCGRVLLNDAPLTTRHHFEEGDVITVGGLMLEFRWKDPQRGETAA